MGERIVFAGHFYAVIASLRTGTFFDLFSYCGKRLKIVVDPIFSEMTHF